MVNEDSILPFVQKLPYILSKPSRLESLEVFINIWMSNEAAEHHRGRRFPPMELVLNLAHLAKVTQALRKGSAHQVSNTLRISAFITIFP